MFSAAEFFVQRSFWVCQRCLKMCTEQTISDVLQEFCFSSKLEKTTNHAVLFCFPHLAFHLRTAPSKNVLSAAWRASENCQLPRETVTIIIASHLLGNINIPGDYGLIMKMYFSNCNSDLNFNFKYSPIYSWNSKAEYKIIKIYSFFFLLSFPFFTCSIDLSFNFLYWKKNRHSGCNIALYSL